MSALEFKHVYAGVDKLCDELPDWAHYELTDVEREVAYVRFAIAVQGTTPAKLAGITIPDLTTDEARVLHERYIKALDQDLFKQTPPTPWDIHMPTTRSFGERAKFVQYLDALDISVARVKVEMERLYWALMVPYVEKKNAERGEL